jgi:hypothetical protein
VHCGGDSALPALHRPRIRVRTTSQDDYLIRIIQQMVQVLLRIAGLKQAGEFDVALHEIDCVTRTLLGPRADALVLLDPTTAAQVIGDPERVLAWARLTSEQAEVHQLQGDRASAERATKRALGLAREAVRLGVWETNSAESLVEGLLQTGLP